ncbi:MAG: SDR family oxidoreductase [Bacteroidales bacterium]|nr:SDR family oxidoreductase [Bacteroidales bacterium]
MVQQKVIIITGASSGIGKALAEAYAAKGASVVLAARSHKEINNLADKLTKNGMEALAVPTDVTKESDCKKLMATTLEHFGRIDVLINNAGISMRAIFEELELDVIRKLMDVNFWGTVYCAKYALPYLLETKGSLVGVISIAGYIGLPGRTGYSASKYAVRGFLDALRVENRKKGLHVLVAAPGFTGTNIRKKAMSADGSFQGETPRDESKMMTAEDVAQRIIKAIEKRKRTLILTFTEGKLSVFLNKFFPGLIDMLSYNHMAKEPDSPFK